MRKIIVGILILIISIFMISNFNLVYASDETKVDSIVDGIFGIVDNISGQAENIKKETESKQSGNSDTTVDDVFSDADDFIKDGENQINSSGGINESKLRSTTDFLYNLLLAIGIVVAVIVGSILGIKYMMGSVEEKAEYKQTLLAYVISCAVVFGAFGIWKLVVNVLSGV